MVISNFGYMCQLLIKFTFQTLFLGSSKSIKLCNGFYKYFNLNFSVLHKDVNFSNFFSKSSKILLLTFLGLDHRYHLLKTLYLDEAGISFPNI